MSSFRKVHGVIAADSLDPEHAEWVQWKAQAERNIASLFQLYSFALDISLGSQKGDAHFTDDQNLTKATETANRRHGAQDTLYILHIYANLPLTIIESH
jgi:hypothetical protein